MTGHRKVEPRRAAPSGGLLGPLESAIFATVSERGEATVAQVHATLSANRKIAYTTVMTILARLAEKGMLTRVKQNRRHVYSVSTNSTGAAAKRFRDLFSGLIADFGDLAIRHFVETASDTDDATLAELESQVRKACARRRKKR